MAKYRDASLELGVGCAVSRYEFAETRQDALPLALSPQDHCESNRSLALEHHIRSLDQSHHVLTYM